MLFQSDAVQQLGIALVSGYIWFAVHEYVLAPYLFANLGFLICRVNPKQIEEGSKLDMKLNHKMPHAMGKVIYKVLVWCLWASFALHFPGWENWRDWQHYVRRLDMSDPELQYITPIYHIYFSAAFFSMFKDMHKKDRANGVAQYLFDLHHLIAVGLTWGSLPRGYWRTGFLTLFFHLPSDIVVYVCKIIQVALECHPNAYASNIIFAIKVILVTSINVSWFITRIVIYGWMNWCVAWMMYESRAEHNWFDNLMLIGTLLMYVLQVVWQLALLEVLVNLIKTGGDVKDKLHSEDVFKKKRS